MEQIRAEDLHAGDWVLNSDNKPVWVAVRGRPNPDGTRRFLLGRGSVTKRDDLMLAPDDPITLLSRWPELPSQAKAG